jgi:PAS domain S-box-containing protein
MADPLAVLRRANAELAAGRRAALNVMEDALQARDAARTSADRLRAVAANLPNGAVFVLGHDLRYELAAGEALAPAGLTPADLEGKALAEVLPPDLEREYAANYRRVLAGEAFQAEHAAHGRHYVTHGVPLRDADGRVTAALAVSYDITDRKRAEAAQARAEEQLRLALTAARMGIWQWDVMADEHARDENLNRLLGLPPERTRRPFADFLAHVHPDDRPAVAAAFDRSVKHARPLNVEFRVVWPDGAVRWLRDQGDVFHTAGSPRLSGACMDITGLKETEEALRRVRDELEERVATRTADLQEEMTQRQELSRRLATVQEDERQRLARDLHDQVGQTLTAIALGLGAVRAAGPLPPAATDRLAGVQKLTDDLGRQLHDLAVRLRPTALDDIGLYAAVGQLLADWSARTGVRVESAVPDLSAARLPPEVETTLYRVVQEALTNVARHARAGRATVTLTRHEGHVLAVVEDDGGGFDPDAATERLGIVGMRERVSLVGGTLEIESRPGGGTAVFVRIPVSH